MRSCPLETSSAFARTRAILPFPSVNGCTSETKNIMKAAACESVTKRAKDLEPSAQGTRNEFRLYERGVVGEVRSRLEFPHSILRVSQLHYFIDLQLQRLARTPLLLPIPIGFRVQSIATADAARELLDVAVSSPRGRCPDLAGPEVMGLGHAARIWRDILGVRRWLLPLPLLGRTAAAFSDGA